MKEQERIRIIVSACDHEIAPIVRDLMEGGLKTFASCQGGPGHSFTNPIVRISPKQTRQKIERVLDKAGYESYYINGSWWNKIFQFWEVEFVHRVPKTGIYLNYALWRPGDEVLELKRNVYFAMSELEDDTQAQ